MEVFGVYEMDLAPYRRSVNVTGDTVEEIKTKYENYVNAQHGYIVNLYPMHNATNKDLYGKISDISVTI